MPSDTVYISHAPRKAIVHSTTAHVTPAPAPWSSSHRCCHRLPRLGRSQEGLQALQPAVNVSYLSAGVRIVVACGRHPLCHRCCGRGSCLLWWHSSNEAAASATACPAIPTGWLLAGVPLQPLPHLQQRPARGGCPLVARREAGCWWGGGPDCRPQPLSAAHRCRPLPRVAQRPAPLRTAVACCMPRPVSTGITTGHTAALRRGVPCSVQGR